jgi:hypothetical protein
MIALYLFVVLTYAFNITIIVSYVKECGKFEMVDLIHIIFSPFTVVNIFVIKFLSHFIPLDYILWSRDDDENNAQR